MCLGWIDKRWMGGWVDGWMCGWVDGFDGRMTDVVTDSLNDRLVGLIDCLLGWVDRPMIYGLMDQ